MPTDIDQLCADLRRIAARRFDFAAYDRRRMLAPHVVLELASLGVFGLHAPRELGGCGLTFEQMVRVEQQLAAIDVTLAAFVGIHNALGMQPILAHGSADQKAALGRFARGHALLGFALTEPMAGSDPGAIGTVAEPCGGDEWRLSGDKLWIGNAGWAQALVVICRLAEAARAGDLQGGGGGFAAFLVPTDRDGVSVGAECETLGLRGIVQNRVRLDGVRVGRGDMLGQPGEGMAVANTAMQLGRLGIGAIAVGAIKRSLQVAVTFATRRQIGGRALAERLSVKAALRDGAAEVAFLETVLITLARAMDRAGPLPEPFSLALKIVASERAWHWADRAVQMLGGRGYDEANPPARILRDVRILRVFEGSTEALQVYLGTGALFAVRGLRDGIAAVAGDTPAARSAVHDIESRRAETLASLRSADPRLTKQLAEAAGLLLGDYVAWRLCALVHALDGDPALPAAVARQLDASDAAWRDWLGADHDGLARWDGDALNDLLVATIGPGGFRDEPDFNGPDDLLRPSAAGSRR